MTVYKPCFRCPKTQDCEIKRSKQSAMSGHGITSVRFRCEVYRTLFRVGQRVGFELMAAADGGDYGRDDVGWTGTVLRLKNDKFTVILDDGWDELTLKNASGIVALSPTRLRALDEPDSMERVRAWQLEYLIDGPDEVRAA